MTAVTLGSTVVAAANQLSTVLDGEAVVLELDSGTYFGLADVGARIWALVQEPITCAALLDVLLDEYAAERSVLERDLLTFVRELRASNLLEVQ